MVSSIGAMRMPWRTHDQRVVLEVLADLEDGRVLEQRLQQRECVVDGIWSGRRAAAAEQVAAAAGVADRHIAGAARRDGQREADEIGAHGVEAGRLGVEGEAAGVAGLRDPGLEAFRRRARSRRCCGRSSARARRSACESDDGAGRAVSRCGAIAFAVGGAGTELAPTRVAPERCRPCTAGADRALQRRRHRDLSASAMRLVSVLNSISRRKFSSGSGCVSCRPSRSIVDLDRHVVLQSAPVRARCAPDRRTRSASRGASAA